MERKSRIVAKAIAIALVLIVVYIFLPVINGIIENPPGENYIIIPKKMEFEFDRTVVISARSFSINFTIPGNNTYQKVSVYDLTNGVNKEIHHEYNRTWWTYSKIGSGEIKIRYVGVTEAKVWHIHDPKNISAIPEYLKKEYNHREYLIGQNGEKRYVIDPDYSKIKETTSKLVKGKNNVEDELRVIYDFIVQNFHYVTERSGEPKTAPETWNSREGDCDELSFVFVSMARSVGIPAWVEYGLLYNGHTWSEHAWVGAPVPYTGGLAKVNIDVTAEVGRKDLGRGFLVRDPFRITEWIEDGNSKHLNAYYDYITYTSPPSLSYSEGFSVIKSDYIGEERVYVGETIPSWLMELLFIIIILVVIAIIIRT